MVDGTSVENLRNKMADKAATSDEWKTERIPMTHLANFSRSSSYVRSLVRQQFHQQSDQPATAWERLRERLAKTGNAGSFDMDEEVPSFVKKRERGNTAGPDSDENSDDEDGNEEEEMYVYLKTASPEHRFSIASETGKDKLEPPASGSTRRLSAPQAPSSTDKKYILGSTDAHSKILNRRLSLAENVIKNYNKYIRTPDVDKPLIKIDNESEREEAGKRLSSVAITEEENSTLVDVKLVNNPENPVSSAPGDFLVVPAGSSYTVPPSPEAENENSFFETPTRRYSSCGVISEELSLIRSGTDVTSEATKNKVAAETLPRLSKTSKAGRKKGSAKSRDEAIRELRDDYNKLAKNNVLNRSAARRRKETFYKQLQRDQERRARESQIFNREMEDITKALKGINSRLDERIKVLNCYEPPRVNVKLHRILQVALAGIPVSK